MPRIPTPNAASVASARTWAFFEALTAISSQAPLGQCAFRSSHSDLARRPKKTPAPNATAPVPPKTYASLLSPPCGALGLALAVGTPPAAAVLSGGHDRT